MLFILRKILKTVAVLKNDDDDDDDDGDDDDSVHCCQNESRDGPHVAFPASTNGSGQ